MSEGHSGRNWVTTTIGIVVVIAVVAGYKNYNKSARSSEVRQSMETWIVAAPGYHENKDVFDELLKEAHKVAFKEAYDVGSRRRSATFDVDKYARVLFSTMQSKAEARGYSEIAKSLAVVEANHATPGR